MRDGEKSGKTKRFSPVFACTVLFGAFSMHLLVCEMCSKDPSFGLARASDPLLLGVFGSATSRWIGVPVFAWATGSFVVCLLARLTLVSVAALSVTTTAVTSYLVYSFHVSGPIIVFFVLGVAPLTLFILRRGAVAKAASLHVLVAAVIACVGFGTAQGARRTYANIEDKVRLNAFDPLPALVHDIETTGFKDVPDVVMIMRLDCQSCVREGPRAISLAAAGKFRLTVIQAESPDSYANQAALLFQQCKVASEAARFLERVRELGASSDLALKHLSAASGNVGEVERKEAKNELQRGFEIVRWLKIPYTPIFIVMTRENTKVMDSFDFFRKF